MIHWGVILAGIILNVPYGCLTIPPAILKRLDLTPEELRREHWFLTDPFLLKLTKLAAQADAKKTARTVVVFPYSPLVIDPLGLLAMEMEKSKLGGPTFIARTTAGKELPKWTDSEQKFILDKTVNPYASELAKECLEQLEKEKFVALVTMRSFSSEPQKHEPNRRYPRPEIALGATEEHTPEGLANLAGSFFRSLGLWPQLNWPISGTALPGKLADQPRLKALGLYLRRDLYLDEKTGLQKDSLDAAVRVVKTFFNLLGDELDRVARLKLKRAFQPKGASSIIKANKATAIIDEQS
jgi:hypothetical protein